MQSRNDEEFIFVGVVAAVPVVSGDNSDGVVCHSDLSTCCSGSQSVHRGDWYFPDGTVLPFAGDTVPIGLGRTAQIAVIRRTTATGPTGIYRCDIATTAVHDDSDISVRDTIYVGLYPTDGMYVFIRDPCQQQ